MKRKQGRTTKSTGQILDLPQFQKYEKEWISNRAMTKQDVAILLSPSVFFIVAAVAAFMMSNMIRQHTRDDGSHEKFDTFVTNVQSGKWQLTTDRWLEGMRREEATSEAYRQASIDAGQMLQVVCWTTVAGIADSSFVFGQKEIKKTVTSNTRIAYGNPRSIRG